MINQQRALVKVKPPRGSKFFCSWGSSDRHMARVVIRPVERERSGKRRREIGWEVEKKVGNSGKKDWGTGLTASHW